VQARRPEILYWRTAAGHEVDFVIKTPNRLLPIEARAATRPLPADARGLEAFLDEYAELADGALLVHGGSSTATRRHPLSLGACWLFLGGG